MPNKTLTITTSGGLSTGAVVMGCGLLGNNRFVTGQTHTAGGADSVMASHLVMGRVASTGKVVPCDTAAIDGSQYPCGLLYLELESSLTVAANATVTNICLVTGGKVDSAKLAFKAGITLDSYAAAGTGLNATPAALLGRRLSDMLMDLGIELVTVTDNTL